MVDAPDADIRRIIARIPLEWGRSIDVGPGWFPLLDALDRHLAALAPGYVVHQCKSKYGTLRYYAQVSDDPAARVPGFDEAILEAELKSSEICEECGAPAERVVIRLWVWTLCTEHAELKRRAQQ